MTIERLSGTLPFGSEAMFDLLADIERYPEFVKGWESVRIERREADTYHLEQTVAYGPARLRFASRAHLARPQRIQITSTDSEFRKYSLTWLIEPVAAGCRIRLIAELELKSRMLQFGLNRFLPAALEEFFAAFETRAHALYGGKSRR